MTKSKEHIILIFVILIAAFLRLYNLMFDAPYFFNPDERNMAVAITRFRLPRNPFQIPTCLISEFIPSKIQFNQQSNNCNLNPHFFSYGQFPLYLAYASDQTENLISKQFLALLPAYDTLKTDNQQLITGFESAIFWLRFWSALFSTAIVLLVFLISRQLLTFNFSLLTATLASFTPGLIQAAHFGTTESLLTFFFLASIYLSFKLLSFKSKSENSKLKTRNSKRFGIWNLEFGIYIIAIAIVLGFALGSKLTGLFFFIPPLTSLMILLIKLWSERVSRIKKAICLFGYLLICLFLIIGSIFFAVISSPYNIIEFDNFRSAVFGYEKDVATGRYQAFYTKQFIDTTPILFQAERIFPYALGWPIFILGFLGFLLINLNSISIAVLFSLRKIQNSKFKVQNFSSKFIILNFAFLIYLFPNAFIFAKWTRFVTPIFPFFTIFASYFLYKIYILLTLVLKKCQMSNVKCQTYILNLKSRMGFKFLVAVLSFTFLALILLPGAAFMSIYTHEDSRVQTSSWIYQNIPSNSYILSETANVVDIPVGLANNEAMEQWNNVEVISFDFYHLDENPLLFDQLLDHVEKADYIFIPSRRIFLNYTRFPQIYPIVSKYYQLLFSGALEFEKVTEFSSFPRLKIGNWELEIDDEQSEETFTVFDHPVIRIYKKTKQFTKEEYRSLFEVVNSRL